MCTTTRSEAGVHCTGVAIIAGTFVDFPITIIVDAVTDLIGGRQSRAFVHAIGAAGAWSGALSIGTVYRADCTQAELNGGFRASTVPGHGYALTTESPTDRFNLFADKALGTFRGVLAGRAAEITLGSVDSAAILCVVRRTV